MKYRTTSEAMLEVIRAIYPAVAIESTQIKGYYESCFSDMECILVIENVGNVDQVISLVPMSCKSCLVVATSRRELSFDAQWLDCLSICVAELSPSAAIEFGLSLAKRTLSDQEVGEICSLCGYLPLPIRLVIGMYNRKRNLSAASLIEKLRSDDHSRLQLVSTEFISAFELYDDDVLGHLLPLSVFPGTFDGLAAAAVYDERYEEAEDALGGLLEHALVEFDPVTARYDQNDMMRLAIVKVAENKFDEGVRNSWKIRFVNHFYLLIYALEMIWHDDGAKRERCLRSFYAEQHNIRICLSYIVQLSNSNEESQFAQTLSCFVQHLDSTEKKHWTSLISQLEHGWPLTTPHPLRRNPHCEGLPQPMTLNDFITNHNELRPPRHDYQ